MNTYLVAQPSRAENRDHEPQPQGAVTRAQNPATSRDRRKRLPALNTMTTSRDHRKRCTAGQDPNPSIRT